MFAKLESHMLKKNLLIFEDNVRYYRCTMKSKFLKISLSQ